MDIKFTTIKGPQTTTGQTYYIGIPQHTAVYSIKQTYEKLSQKLGFTVASITAAFKAFSKVIRDNAEMANSTTMKNVLTAHTSCTGSFASMQGPWVAGKNLLILGVTTAASLRNALAGATLVNNTAGANPLIKSVFDETTKLYDVITGTDVISIAGADLAVDMTKTDEGVWLKSAAGVETKLTVSSSDLQVVKAALTTALTAGEYTLIVRTRSGLGEEFGVAEATRKVTVSAIA